MKINRHLVWDYEIPPRSRQDDYFKRWYIARVLMRGGPRDLRNVGAAVIRQYLPRLSLPARIRRFWEWYFQEVHGKNHRRPHTPSS